MHNFLSLCSRLASRESQEKWVWSDMLCNSLYCPGVGGEKEMESKVV